MKVTPFFSLSLIASSCMHLTKEKNQQTKGKRRRRRRRWRG
jgi:hypothetical protein